MLEFVLIDFAFLTTLFKFVEPVGEPVHGLNEELPLVKSDKPADCGTAIPLVSEKEIPKTEDDVSLLQKTPKSNPSPAKPTVESAAFALSTFAK